ncbi:MAG: hypothetical protein ACI4EG_03195 [Fusicatenibacter sp.]
MKCSWSRFEILVTCISAAIIPMAAWLTAIALHWMFGPNTTPLSLSAFFMVSLVCTTALVRFLKMRGKHVWPAAAVLSVLLALLGLASTHLWEFTQLVHPLTGHYNSEAIGFSILFLILLCAGTLAGIGAGSLLSSVKGSK